MVRLPDGEKILKIRLLVLTESTNVTDGHTHRRKPHDGIGRACMHRAAKTARKHIFFLPINRYVFETIENRHIGTMEGK